MPAASSRSVIEISRRKLTNFHDDHVESGNSPSDGTCALVAISRVLNLHKSLPHCIAV